MKVNSLSPLSQALETYKQHTTNRADKNAKSIVYNALDKQFMKDCVKITISDQALQLAKAQVKGTK